MSSSTIFPLDLMLLLNARTSEVQAIYKANDDAYNRMKQLEIDIEACMLSDKPYDDLACLARVAGPKHHFVYTDCVVQALELVHSEMTKPEVEDDLQKYAALQKNWGLLYSKLLILMDEGKQREQELH